MKIIATAILALLMPALALADAVVLKSGRKIEWKTLRDKGDAYDLEALDGTAMVVQKKDVERIEIAEVRPILAGASVAFEGKTKTVDILPSVNPKRDTVFGAVKFGGGGLVVASEIDAPTFVKLPVKAPEEYDLSISVDRKSTIGNFYVGLVGAGSKQFMVEFDSQGGSLSVLHGGNSHRGTVLEKGAAHSILIQVRKEAVVVTVDKKELLSCKGGIFGLSSPHQLLGNDASLFIGTQRIYGNAEHANFLVSKVALITKP